MLLTLRAISRGCPRSSVKSSVRTQRKGGEWVQGFIMRTANRPELQSNKDIQGILKFVSFWTARFTTPTIKSKQNQGNNLCLLTFTPQMNCSAMGLSFPEPRSASPGRAPVFMSWHWPLSPHCASKPLRLAPSGGQGGSHSWSMWHRQPGKGLCRAQQGHLKGKSQVLPSGKSILPLL